jgi:hypothetical protein
MGEKYSNINIRVPETFKKQLEAMASEKMLSLSSFCRTQLAELLRNWVKNGDGK